MFAIRTLVINIKLLKIKSKNTGNIYIYIFLILVPGDKSAMNPYGIRLGTPALTTRGLKENDISVVAELIHKGMFYNNN